MSIARTKMLVQLKDFDELIEAREAICPPTEGRPAKRRGAAVLRAAVLLLCSALEAYIEEVFDISVEILLQRYPAAERTQLKKNTSGTFNNASPFKIDMLFFNLGIPWITQNTKVRWRKFSNTAVRNSIQKLIDVRNSNSHGNPKTVRKQNALRWKSVVERFTEKVDDFLAEHVEGVTGSMPW